MVESFSQMFMQVTEGVLERSGAACGWVYLLEAAIGRGAEELLAAGGFAGDTSPDGMQRLLDFSPWDVKTARDATARYVVKAMGDPAAVLAVNDTGSLKTGRMSAGVTRMYTGTAGRVENCRVSVFAAYVTPDGSGR